MPFQHCCLLMFVIDCFLPRQGVYARARSYVTVAPLEHYLTPTDALNSGINSGEELEASHSVY